MIINVFDAACDNLLNLVVLLVIIKLETVEGRKDGYVNFMHCQIH